MVRLAHTAASRSEVRLLVLDDDPAVGETVLLMGERLGVTCRATTEAAAFFDELQNFGPTHILLDLAMPHQDGIETIQQLADSGCRAVIILASGVGFRVLDAARRAAENHGLRVAGSIAKPFSLAQLNAMLSTEPVQHEPSTADIESAPEPRLRVNRAMLTRALDLGQIDVALQPKVHCSDGTLAGFEALARWDHPIHGPIPPDRFISVAERTELISPLTEMVFDRAFRWFAGLGLPRVSLAMNVSGRSLADTELADRISQITDQYRVEPTSVIIEVTESSAIYDQQTALDLLIRLRLKGFRLSIDDFGVGYSSLSQLARMPFSELKLDRSFVSTVEHSAESRSIVRGITGLAKSLGLSTVAEGVEDLATFRFLREAGCDEAQGYLIGRPMDREALAYWLGGRGTTSAVPAEHRDVIATQN